MSAPNRVPAGWPVEMQTMKNDQPPVVKDKVIAPAEKSRDGLPPGWSKEIKISRRGVCRDVCYMDWSGHRYSKAQACHYLQTDQLPTNRVKAKKEVIAPAENSLDGLPPGWTKEMSLSLKGVCRDAYIDPITGYMFRSKRDVFRYLVTGELGRRVPKTKNTKGIDFSVIAPAENSPDGLPPGWTKKIKFSRRGVHRDPDYIDPATGYVFRSKRDVFHYLETGQLGRHLSIPKNSKGVQFSPPTAAISPKFMSSTARRTPFVSQSLMPKQANYSHSSHGLNQEFVKPIRSAPADLNYSREETCMERSSDWEEKNMSTQLTPTRLEANKRSINEVIPPAENSQDELPPGWTKILKSSRRGKRRNAYYIDPVAGYVFRHKRDVFRYLETGELGRHVSKPQNSKGVNLTPPTAAVSPKLMGSTAKRALFVGQSLIPEQAYDSHSSHDPNQYAEFIVPISSVPPDLEYSNEKHSTELLLEWEDNNMVGDKVSNTDNILENGNAVKGNKFLKNGDPPEMEANKLMERSVPPPELKDSKLQEDALKKCKKTSSRKAKAENATLLPSRKSKRLAGLSPDIDPGVTDRKRTHHLSAATEPVFPKSDTAKDRDQIEVSINANSTVKKSDEKLTSEMNSTIVSPLMKLRCDKPSNRNSESPSTNPFGNLWPDPCLEFAFKTLVDAIPVECWLQSELSESETGQRKLSGA